MTTGKPLMDGASRERPFSFHRLGAHSAHCLNKGVSKKDGLIADEIIIISPSGRRVGGTLRGDKDGLRGGSNSLATARVGSGGRMSGFLRVDEKGPRASSGGVGGVRS